MIAIAVPRNYVDHFEPLAELIRERGLECGIYGETDLHVLPDPEMIEILVPAAAPCGAKEMDLMPRLRAIVSPVIGFDWVDIDAATQRGIIVANTEAQENRESMAEATILLLLTLLYRLRDTEALLRDNLGPDTVERHLLKSRTIGIIGFGGIAQEVLERLAPWGCEFLITCRSEPAPIPKASFVPLDQLLEQSDAILVLTREDEQTRRMIGAEQFAKVRPGTLLVNTARGGILDEEALIEALRSGRIGAAALDVFDKEPLDTKSPLRELPNVILTPHCIGHTHESRATGPRVAAENVLQIVEGKIPDSCKNSEALARNPPS